MFVFVLFALAWSQPAPTVVWNQTIPAQPFNQLVANQTSNTIVMVGGGQISGRRGDTGELLWNASYDGAFAAAYSQFILFQDQGSLKALSLSGKLLFSVPFSTPIMWSTVAWPYFAVDCFYFNGSLGFSALTGQQLWSSPIDADYGFSSCGPTRICYLTRNGMVQLDAKTGTKIWGPIDDFDLTTSRGVYGDKFAVGSGRFAGMSYVVLANLTTGETLWNISLTRENGVVDLLMTDTKVIVTYVIGAEKQDKNNAYPCEGVALDINTGRSLFGFKPRGETMGETMLLENGDIVYYGDEGIFQVDGSTGKPVCVLSENVQDYNQVHAPAVVGSRFFATYWLLQSGYTKQFLVALECKK